MPELRCRNCSLAIIPPQQVILARIAYPTRADESPVKPLNGDKPEVFHAGCLPLGWLLLPGGPMSLDAALAQRAQQ